MAFDWLYLNLETTNEPVQVSNKYDCTQIKNAVDDELSRVNV